MTELPWRRRILCMFRRVSLCLVALAAVLAVPATAGAAPLVVHSHDFTSAPDGWRSWYPGAPSATDLVAAGGTLTISPQSGKTMYFMSPASWTHSWVNVIGGKLKFKLDVAPENSIDIDDILLTTSNGDLNAQLTAATVTNGNNYSLPMVASSFRKMSGAAVSADEFKTLLSTVFEVKIRATVPTTPSADGVLDDVVLETADAADIFVDYTTANTDVKVGDVIDYTVLVGNYGPAVATNVVMTDVLPANTELVSMGAACQGTTTVTCTFATINPGMGKQFHLKVKPTAATGQYTHTPSVTGSLTDPDTSDNSDSITSIVRAVVTDTDGDGLLAPDDKCPDVTDAGKENTPRDGCPKAEQQQQQQQTQTQQTQVVTTTLAQTAEQQKAAALTAIKTTVLPDVMKDLIAGTTAVDPAAPKIQAEVGSYDVDTTVQAQALFGASANAGRAVMAKATLLGSASLSLPKGTKGKLSMKLNKKGKALLKKKGKLKISLVVRVSEPKTGATAAASKVVTLKARKKKRK